MSQTVQNLFVLLDSLVVHDLVLVTAEFVEEIILELEDLPIGRAAEVLGDYEILHSHEKRRMDSPRGDSRAAVSDVLVEKALGAWRKGEMMNSCGSAALTGQRHHLRVTPEIYYIVLNPLQGFEDVLDSGVSRHFFRCS